MVKHTNARITTATVLTNLPWLAVKVDMCVGMQREEEWFIIENPVTEGEGPLDPIMKRSLLPWRRPAPPAPLSARWALKFGCGAKQWLTVQTPRKCNYSMTTTPWRYLLVKKISICCVVAKSLDQIGVHNLAHRSRCGPSHWADHILIVPRCHCPGIFKNVLCQCALWTCPACIHIWVVNTLFNAICWSARYSCIYSSLSDKWQRNKINWGLVAQMKARHGMQKVFFLHMEVYWSRTWRSRST